MIRIETSITINRPPEEIFDHWADGRLYNQWTPGAVKHDVRMVTPEPIGVGSKFRGTFKGIGELEYEILEYDRPRRLAMVTHVTIGDLYHTITCERVGDATRVVELGEGHLRGMFKLLQPLFALIFKQSFADNDQALKQYLEGASAVTKRSASSA
jgi:uncharacterized protein YndB with AHSA1/START domain